MKRREARTIRPRLKVPPGEWTPEAVDAFNSARVVSGISLDLEKIIRARTGATLGDLASAAHALGVELHVVTTPKQPKPTVRRRRGKR